MSLASAAARARRLLRKDPRYLAARAWREARAELDRWLARARARRLDRDGLLRLANALDIDTVWMRVAARPFPAATDAMDPAALEAVAPGEPARVLAAADRACDRVVDLLGTGPITLGTPAAWSRDYRTGAEWPAAFARDTDYVNRHRASDVKVPWEISRLQWLIPAGQGYRLTGDERYAAAARDVLDEWIDANPLAYSVNWAVAMEAALRIFTWTWLFHVFAASPSWRDEAFRVRFLSGLYLHGDFVARHIEKSNVNGNHYTADLAGLVMAAGFFGEVGEAPRWGEEAWSDLVAELPRQVFADGVDYEASTAYHRLVFELFLWPALFRKALNQAVPAPYTARLRAMARFTAAYSRSDGTSPLWGDADDARALPFGGQAIGDHRYLIGLAALAFDDAELASLFGGPRAELAWTFDPERAAALPSEERAVAVSAAFPDGGLYVMRHGGTHLFIDCGPVGLAGRGGHGHNDALSLELWLDGVPLVVDSGSYVYTASFDARNRFRATAAHNTPQVDGAEINRFDPEQLWTLADDAQAACREWLTGRDVDLFEGSHRGYARLGVEVRRRIRFDKTASTVEITDSVTGEGAHDVVVPLHLAPGTTVTTEGADARLQSGERTFDVVATGAAGWTLAVEPCSVSPHYGVLLPSHRLAWRWQGPLPTTLTVTIRPVG